MRAGEMNVFVTDGDERPALAITRSLGRHGAHVLVGAEQSVSLASSSKYCARHVTYPSPRRHPKEFEHFLVDLVRREGVDAIVPVTDVAMHAIASNQEAFRGHCAIAAPPFEAFERVTNKATLLQAAAACGIPVPRTEFVDGIAGLKDVIDRLEYPAVVKPVRSRIPTDTGWLATTVHYARSPEELWGLYREIEYLASYPTLIQQRIVGPGHGIFVLFDHGRLRTAFAHRRLREKPPSGGASVLCESVAVDPELRAQARRLLGPLGWHGVAMLEYKQDRRTGKSFLMEVNGRFWGSLQLSIDAGVDFPYLTYQLAAGQPLDLPGTYHVGLKNRWLLGDLDHLWLRLFRSSRELPDGTPSKLRTLLEFLKFAAPGLRYDVMGFDDPHPMFYELQHYAKVTAGSAIESMRGRITRVSEARHLRPAVIADPVQARGKNADALR